MNNEQLQKYALTAEIVGGLAVVVTLIVLIFQVRDNTGVIRSQELNTLRSQFIEAHKFLAEHSDTHIKSFQSPEDLTLEEIANLAQYYAIVSIPLWQYWESYNAGVITEEDMEEALIFAPAYFSTGFGNVLWNEAKSGYPSDFVEAIELRIDNETVDSDIDFYLNIQEELRSDGI